MQQNPNNFSIQEALRMANTPAGQQLLALLKRTDSETVRKAMAYIADGDLMKAKQLLEPMLDATEVQKIIGQTGGKQYG